MKRHAWLVLVVLLGAFLLGLVHLFALRFEQGDIYPPYSSLRADPLGSKALFESLARLLDTRRHFRSLDRLGAGHQSTLFYLGATAEDLRLAPDQLRSLELFVGEGGRLVLSLHPSYQRVSGRAQPAGLSAKTTPPSDSRSGQTNQPPPARESRLHKAPEKISLWERWGATLDQAALPESRGETPEPVEAGRELDLDGLPTRIVWHAPGYLKPIHESWRVVYARTPDRPVMMERRFGDGTLVLVTDSFFLSNEGLLEEPYPGLLTWLVGPARRVLFDEAHLGVREEPGIASLSRKYRLQGFFAGLLWLAILFVWKNSLSFLPPSPADQPESEGGLVKGREAAAGMVNLLRRNIPLSDILSVCLNEWKKACGRQVPTARLPEIHRVLDEQNQVPRAQRDPVRIYRQISQILTRRRGGAGPGR